MSPKFLRALLLLAFMTPACAGLGTCPEVNLISPETLKGMLGDSQVLILDVRAPKSWAESADKIPGAVRYDPSQAKVWGPTLPQDKQIVLYCT
jgi:rhodanese-related sulfurtransferase